MHLLMKQVSVIWLFTCPVTVNRLNIPGRGQSYLKQGRPLPSLLAMSSYSKQVINKTGEYHEYELINFLKSGVTLEAGVKSSELGA